MPSAMCPPRVLVVDDEYSQRRLFCHFLSKKGYQTSALASGAETLAKAPAICPQLALVDISMPGMDGIELFKRLRTEPATRLLPVVLMTGLSVPESVLVATAEHLSAGAIYIKGHDLQELLDKIEYTLRIGAPLRMAGKTDHLLQRGTILVDTQSRRLWIDDMEVHKLPGRRFDLFCALLRSAKPLHRRTLLELVWQGSDNSNIVDVNILRLRQDLKKYANIQIETTPQGFVLSQKHTA